MANEIKLPKLKENVETVEVNEVLVAPGQVVEKDQALMVVNADKSNMEVLAPVAGRVVQFKVKVGDELKIGAVYCTIEANGEAPAPAAKAPSSAGAAAVKKDAATDEPRPQAA